KAALGKTFTFKTVDDVRRFATVESAFWLESKSNLGNRGGRLGNFCNAGNNFKIAYNQLTEWQSSSSSWDDHTLQSEVNTHVLPHLRKLPNFWLWSNHPLVSAWQD